MMLVDCGRPFSLGGEKGEDRGFSESFGKDRVVVAYADAPGTYHPDGKAPSLFADAFARNVVTPDRISIQAVLRRVNDDVMHASDGQQRPWFQTSLDLPIYFRADLLPEEAGEPSAKDLVAELSTPVQETLVHHVQKFDFEHQIRIRRNGAARRALGTIGNVRWNIHQPAISRLHHGKRFDPARDQAV